MRTKQEWTALFQKLKAPYPEQWAECEVSEDLGNLPKAAFLKRAWEEIPRSGDGKWISEWIGHARKQLDESAIVEAYERLSPLGERDADLATFMRGVMGQYLLRLSYMLDDNGHENDELEDAASWGLYQEADDDPVRRLGCIHELVFSMDPESHGS